MRRSLRAPILFVLALLVPSAAFAQQKASGIVETKTDSGYQVWFPLDNLAAAGNDPTGGIVKGGPHASRMMLMKPRLQFVPEMLKSVETL